MQRIIKKLFILSIIGFAIVGFLLVLGQIAGLVIMNGTMIIKSSEYLSTIAYLLSAVAAILGFILHYMKVKEE
ncbi:hypothetical protein [Oceanobacillus jeddahense]|uniref:hypothetical protein n=1 Tax=Oceanobacillus jeddahense TaxID=1462527 RepID=UPI000595FC3D|nr:hypothetical protein [Oceanobacillus jeddahense]